MTPEKFIAKWQRAQLSERSACHQHFLDLCDLLGQPKPAEADPEGAWYTFERGCRTSEGGQGWADVWMKGRFGWEYKGKHKDLGKAYDQLLRYRESLENPPLLVVCDLDRFEVHTNFTGTAKKVYAFALENLPDPANLDVLRKVFTDPEALRPGITTAVVTENAAAQFGKLADGMRVRGVPASDAAHFLMKLIFCMFAEDIGLLPAKLFSKLLGNSKHDPAKLSRQLKALFRSMAEGGEFGSDEILHFNGGLFADSEVIELSVAEIAEVIQANEYDWAEVEPSIFGTLFERTLDPSKRSQIGAHYTVRQDILTLLEPVVMTPLRREWDEVRQRCEKLWDKVRQTASAKSKGAASRVSKPAKDLGRALQDFVERLAHVSILDPACGSGNFLYLAIGLLLDLEKEVLTYAQTRGVSLLPQVRPTQLYGIEINPFAQQLAQVVIWIGYLQWKHHNGYQAPRNPVLEPIDTIQQMDAIIDLTDTDHPSEPQWPKADYIVGNPPFLGGKMLRTQLGDEYVDTMFRVWDDRVPREADLVVYWFEKARDAIKRKRCLRAGLLATQGIRGGANRKVLERIKESGDIFFAESDRPWVLDGANVHVSMVGFDNGDETERTLDGNGVTTINANLSYAAATHDAQPLKVNAGVGFMGVTKQGPFEISDDKFVKWLQAPNAHGVPNSDVLRPYLNGQDVTKVSRGAFLIDFPHGGLQDTAARYELPFSHAKELVQPFRASRERGWFRDQWWELYAPRPEFRSSAKALKRYLATPRVAKHRLFVWLRTVVLPDCQLIAFARDDDYFFGVLHSRAHEVWALAQGTQVRERESGFRYTPTTCFETFPFPEPSKAQQTAIAAAAKELDELRGNWLNPPEWTREEVLEFPGSVDGPWARYVTGANAKGIGTVRYPRQIPNSEDAARELKKRTLTNLYNQRPNWLDIAHRKLDAAVFAAYGWPVDLSDDEILARLLKLNLAQAGR